MASFYGANAFSYKVPLRFPQGFGYFDRSFEKGEKNSEILLRINCVKVILPPLEMGVFLHLANIALSLSAVGSQNELYNGLPQKEKASHSVYIVPKVTSLDCNSLIKDAVTSYCRLSLCCMKILE